MFRSPYIIFARNPLHDSLCFAVLRLLFVLLCVIFLVENCPSREGLYFSLFNCTSRLLHFVSSLKWDSTTKLRRRSQARLYATLFARYNLWELSDPAKKWQFPRVPKESKPRIAVLYAVGILDVIPDRLSSISRARLVRARRCHDDRNFIEPSRARPIIFRCCKPLSSIPSDNVRQGTRAPTIRIVAARKNENAGATSLELDVDEPDPIALFTPSEQCGACSIRVGDR